MSFPDDLENFSRTAVLSGLRVTDMTVQGAAVTRHNGRVIFLESPTGASALPGAVVTARLTGEERKGALFGEILEILEPSPHAVAPWCPHAGECGACLWQDYDLAGARLWKERHVRETLARIGRTSDISITPVLPSPLAREYRNKMVFAFAPDPEGSGRCLLGLRKRSEQSVVEVTHCGMQPPQVMRLLSRMREATSGLGLTARQTHVPSARSGKYTGSPGYLRFLIVHTPFYHPNGSSQMLVECITGPEHGSRTQPGTGQGGLENAAALQKLGQTLLREFGLAGFVHSERCHSADVAQGERIVTVLGSSHYEEQFGHMTLTVPHDAFLQTNTGAAVLLYDHVAREAGLTGTEVVWDLYCGVGAIALYLAGRAGSVHGFEIQSQAVAAARKNSVALGMEHARFYAGPASRMWAKAPSPDIIIVDPPRAGLGEDVVELLRGSRARMLLYVSCAMGTQARDVARLQPVWQAVKSQPVDMFPYTPHVENLLTLTRCDV